MIHKLTPQQQEQHDRLVAMYAEQDRLPVDDVLFEWYEPIVTTRQNMIRIGHGSRIDSFVKLEGGQGLQIGKFVHIASFAHVGVGGGLTVLEDYSAVATHAAVISGSNRPDGTTMSACAPKEMQVIERYITTLKRYATVCANAVVLPGVTLHEGAVLAAGSVATKDIPAWEVWAGVPATFIARRIPKAGPAAGGALCG